MTNPVTPAYYSFVSQYHYLEAFWLLAAGEIEVEGWEFYVSRGRYITTPELINDSLSMMGFLHLEAILENFLLDALETLYEHDPKVIPGDRDRTIRFGDIISASSKEEIIGTIIHQEVRGVPRSLPTMIMQFKRFGLDLSEKGLALPYFQEMGATRNVWAHNGGLVDRRYLEDSEDYWKMVDREPPEEGDERRVSSQYFGHSMGRSRKLADKIQELTMESCPGACTQESPEPPIEELEPWEQVSPWELSISEWRLLRLQIGEDPEEARRYLKKVLSSGRPIEDWTTNRGESF